MRFTVIGAGSIGSAVASALVDREGVSLVKICDARARALEAVHQEIAHPKLRSFQVDVRDFNVLEPILRGSDAAISCVAPEFSPRLARLCLDHGIHYCDLGGGDGVLRDVLRLHDEAVQKSVWIVPNNGLSPGLVNVLCLHGVSQFDTVDLAQLRVGDVPLEPNPPFNFRISWSAQKIIEDYTNPSVRIEHGELSSCEPLTGLETIHFGAPFGAMEAFHTAGGLSSLARDLEGRVQRLDYKTVRWPGHADQMRFLLALGFGDNRSIDVRTHLTYRDVLVRRMRQRLGGEYEDAVLLRLLIRGQQEGRERTLVYEMVDRFDPDTGITAMKRCTSIPVAVVAYLIGSRRIAGGGAAPPERVIPHDLFFDLVTASGLDIQTTWYDGSVPIGNPSEAIAA